ncbi:hypothetical protein ACFY0A_38945 [Streptomyces sp. NPDC001698]|uniref:hypothetical protein n=1 Tax=Streptomyces sp. NPDC001698 TaxID=3364601 RepID=UPI0036B10D86
MTATLLPTHLAQAIAQVAAKHEAPPSAKARSTPSWSPPGTPPRRSPSWPDPTGTGSICA